MEVQTFIGSYVAIRLYRVGRIQRSTSHTYLIYNNNNNKYLILTPFLASKHCWSAFLNMLSGNMHWKYYTNNWWIGNWWLSVKFFAIYLDIFNEKIVCGSYRNAVMDAAINMWPLFIFAMYYNFNVWSCGHRTRAFIPYRPICNSSNARYV